MGAGGAAAAAHALGEGGGSGALAVPVGDVGAQPLTDATELRPTVAAAEIAAWGGRAVRGTGASPGTPRYRRELARLRARVSGADSSGAPVEDAGHEHGQVSAAPHARAHDPAHWRAEVVGGGAAGGGAAATGGQELKRLQCAVAELSAQLEETAAARDEALARLGELGAAAEAHAADAARLAVERDAATAQVNAALVAAEDRVLMAETATAAAQTTQQRERALFTSSISELEARLTESEARLKAAETRSTQFQEAAETGERERAGSKARVVELEETLREAEARLTRFQEAAETSGRERAESLTRVAELEETLAKVRQASTAGINEFMASLAYAEVRVTELSEADAERNELKGKVSELTSEVSVLRTKVSDLSVQLQTVKGERDLAVADARRIAEDARESVAGATEAAERAKVKAAAAQDSAEAAREEALVMIEEADGALSGELRVQLAELEKRAGAERAAASELGARHAAAKEAALAEAATLAERAEKAEAALAAAIAAADRRTEEVAESLGAALGEKDATIGALRDRLATFESAIAERDALLLSFGTRTDANAHTPAACSSAGKHLPGIASAHARAGARAATLLPGTSTSSAQFAGLDAARSESRARALRARVRAADETKEAAVSEITELVLAMCEAFQAAPSREGAAIIESTLPTVPEAVLRAVSSQLRGDSAAAAAGGAPPTPAPAPARIHSDSSAQKAPADALAALLAHVTNAAAETMRRNAGPGAEAGADSEVRRTPAAMGQSPQAMAAAAHAAGVNLAAATAIASAPEIATLLADTRARLARADADKKAALAELASMGAANPAAAMPPISATSGTPGSTQRMASAVLAQVAHANHEHAAELEAVWDDIEGEATERRARRLSGIDEGPDEGAVAMLANTTTPAATSSIPKKMLVAAIRSSGLAGAPSSPSASSVERLLATKIAVRRDVDSQLEALASTDATLGEIGRALAAGGAGGSGGELAHV